MLIPCVPFVGLEFIYPLLLSLGPASSTMFCPSLT